METTLSHPPMATATQHISTPRRVGLVMTYNQKEICIEAINSLIAQTLALDLIIVSDDRSTDGTYELIADYFSKNGKPSNVELYQSEKNLGFIPHFNVLLKNHCRDDDLIFYNAGDDISETSRVEEFYREYATKGKPRHFLGHSYVTSFGSGTEEILVPPIESIKENRELCLIASAYHIGASQVFTGALFFDFGPILFNDCYEDLTLGYRALLKDAYHFIPKALLRYRVGGLSSWQKNPLEKKRSRLKSTLTQRAVDSMRSGDFEALKIIQDCYSQYGFSHTPHPNRVRVIIVSDETSDPGLYTYSISDHFRLVSNICEASQKTSVSVLESIDCWERGDQVAPDLVWIAASRIKPQNVMNFLERITSITKIKLVFDLGLSPSLEAMFPGLCAPDIEKRFIDNLSNISIHTANIHLYKNLLTLQAHSRTTCLPPLQDVDGPDPTLLHPGERRGIVIVIGENDQVEKSLSIFEKAYETNKLGIAKPDIFRIGAPVSSGPINTKNDIEQHLIYTGRGLDLLKYDYLAIFSSPSLEDASSVHYWWSSGARYCLPAFVNSDAARFTELVNGNNCLFVNSSIDAWLAAFDIVRSRTDSLHVIASNARRAVYFNFSVQKRVSQLGELISNSCDSKQYFDKFLPL
jgi:hypothetical protein